MMAPGAESGRKVLGGGRVIDDPALLPKLAKVTRNTDAWEGLGLSRGRRRTW
jgi:hypothetical protein